MFHWNPDERLDDRWIIGRIKDIVKPKDDSNTRYALKHGSIIREEDTRNNRYNAYLVIDNFSEKIKLEQRQDKAKKAIIGSLLSNLSDIVHNSIVAGGTMNPLQFTYRDEEGELTGWLRMRDFYLDFPSDINIRDFYSEEQLLGLVRFGDRLGSLSEQGIDEMGLRAEQERRDRERQEQIMRDMIQYEEMVRNTVPGGHIGMPPMSYIRNQVQSVTREQVESSSWGADVAGNTFGTGAVMYHYAVDEASSIDRATLEQLARPSDAVWTSSLTNFEDEYPTESDINTTVSSA